MASGVGLAMTLVSGAVSAYSSYQKGKAEDANHKYNASLAESQAKQQEMEAQENARRGWKNAEEQLASVRARLANQGSVANTGAPLAVMGDIAAELELGIDDAYRQAEIQRTNLLQEAKIQRWQGAQSKKAGKLMAVSTLLGTGADLAFKMREYKRSGLYEKDKATMKHYYNRVSGRYNRKVSPSSLMGGVKISRRSGK